MECNKENYIGYYIKVIQRNLNNLYNRKLEKYDLTNAQLCIIWTLLKNDGLTQREVAEHANITPATLTELVDSLVSKGFIIRMHDEKDARAKRLFLTEEGKKLKDILIETTNFMEECLCKDFSEEERLLLLSWLKKMYKNLE